MQRMLAVVPVTLALTGCLAAKLKGPAEDHYVQARTISDRCLDRAGPEQCADLVAMCDQAEAIDAIARGKEARGCYDKEISP